MRATRASVVAFLVCVGPAMAGYWDIEKVDSAGWGASVDMRWHPDGRLFLCYSDTSGIMRLASKDSIWSYENLPQWRSVIPGTQAFDVDARGIIGVSYISTDNRYWYALKTDTGWSDIQTPFYSWSRSPTALDTNGTLALTVQVDTAFLLVRRVDTSWTADTIMKDATGFGCLFGCSSLGALSDGRIWGVFWSSYSWPKDINATHLFSFKTSDSGMTVNLIVGDADNVLTGASGCLDDTEAVHSSYGNYAQIHYGLYFDQIQLDTERVLNTAVRLDSFGQPRVAFTNWGRTLRFFYSDLQVKHFMDVGVDGVTALALLLAIDGEPLIGFTTPNGVFLARGVGITALSEERQRPTDFGSRRTAAVVRGVLRIPDTPSSIHASLFDMTGRRVVGLHPGANDVGVPAPGVYFVREAQAQAQAQAVRKIVITR